MLSFNPPQTTPEPTDTQFKGWLTQQFQNIRKAANTAVDAVFLRTQNSQPARTNDGDMRLADGVNWDPRFGLQMPYWYSANDGEWKGLVSVGSGGTVTQATDKTTAVTLNNVTGQITTNNASLASATAVSFTLTNSFSQAGGLIVLNHVSGGIGNYDVYGACAAGSVTITIYNQTAGSLSQALGLRFLILPGATS